MTTYYDGLDFPIPGSCCNCGAVVGRIVKGRCRLCHDYQARHGGQERPASLWQSARPVWQEVKQRHAVLCDCGKPAAWKLTTPIGERAQARLLLCDECAALERALAPAHSWKGG